MSIVREFSAHCKNFTPYGSSEPPSNENHENGVMEVNKFKIAELIKRKNDTNFNTILISSLGEFPFALMDIYKNDCENGVDDIYIVFVGSKRDLLTNIMDRRLLNLYVHLSKECVADIRRCTHTEDWIVPPCNKSIDDKFYHEVHNEKKGIRGSSDEENIYNSYNGHSVYGYQINRRQGSLFLWM